MIPLKLQIKNFLSYGSNTQVIDFTHHRLICLSGKNGHGKSALLDAITWSLWGQARKVGATSKPDQGLLRLGEVEMSVCFDFEFNRNKYRVRRDFSKKYGKPHAHLEFGMLQEDDYFVSLTDKTLRKTQETIDHTLGIDYETFTNSSFLRQGGANEFSKKSAKERKEVLSTILGLHHYDKARSSALEKTRILSTEKQHLEKLQEHTNQEYETLKTIPEEQQSVEKNLEIISKKTKTLLLQKADFLKQKEELHEQEQTYKILAATFEQKAIEHKKQREHLNTVVSQWKETHKLLLTLPDKTALEAEHTRLTQAVTQQQETFQKSLKLKEIFLIKKEALSQLTTILEKDFLSQQQTEKLAIERLKAQQEALEKNKKTLIEFNSTSEKKLIELQNEIAKLRKTISPDLLVSDFQEQQKLFERYKSLYQKWVEQGNWVNNQLKELDQKQSLSQHTDNPSCPLCEQNLSQARKRFLYKKFSDHSHLLLHRFNRLKKTLEKLKPYLHEFHNQLGKLTLVEQLLKEQHEITKQQIAHQETFKNLEITEQEFIKALAEVQKKLIKLEQETATFKINNHEISSLQNEINSLEKELLETRYQANEHKQLSEELQHINNRLKQCQELPQYKAIQAERKATVHSLCCALKTIEKEQKTTFKILEQQTIHAQKIDLLTTQQTALEKEFEAFCMEREKLLETKGTLAAQAQKYKDLEALQKEQSQKVAQLNAEIYDLQQIALALGKDGIQALLIEDAIPEIEQEANDLLSRLTDNQARISIESLRDLKKGGTRETLDINISDATGIRPYEMFSGGEAFRIDFALRIAISKLLARRAGTSLQTLIIDEGFGSQDEEGLNRIMDALYTIQEDFEKVIIVSHLDAMKEQFPVHFYIHKDPNGSKVTIIEHG